MVVVPDEILTVVRQSGFNIVAMRQMELTAVMVNDLYRTCMQQDFFPDLMKLMTR